MLLIKNIKLKKDKVIYISKVSEKHLGEISYNKFGTPMQIINYNSSTDIRIKFLDDNGYEMNTNTANFKIGQISNPYDKKIHGVGYLGEGKYYTDKTELEFKTYCAWRKMLERCYSEKFRHLNIAYIGCTVCKEWHCYQTFAEWYITNYNEVGTERMHIDKDILIKDNKIYSPETCIIVPQRINMIFMTKTRVNDADLPNAICRCVNGFKAAYNGKSLGVYKTLEEAIEKHDSVKRIHIRKVAEEYKGKIQTKLYDAMLRW